MNRPTGAPVRLNAPFAKSPLGGAGGWRSWSCALVASFALLGCGGTSSTETTGVVTGVALRAETVTQGRGCGLGATQIFKYAVVVRFSPDGAALSGNVFDCFADAIFVELDPGASGQASYQLDVFGFSAPAYERAGGDNTIRELVARRNSDGLRANGPTLTTTCTAGQIVNAQTLAVCGPLVAPAAPPPTGGGSTSDGGA